MSARRARSNRFAVSAAVRRDAAPRTRDRRLLVIDNRPLQEAAWASLRRARQRLEKATKDLHRHEEIDEPAFRSWVGATFPELVNAVRELSLGVETKRRLVEAVSSEAFFSGRSEAAVWREWQKHGGGPPPPLPDDLEPETAEDDWGPPPEFPRDFPPRGGRDEGFEDFMRLFNGEISAEEYLKRDHGLLDRFGASLPPAPPIEDARAIYRRLVQHLHPDRGGEWTPARAQLWDQLQQAWDHRDADWLARLEVEWEARADLLNANSALGRLLAAVEEIDAARRDADRKVRVYRKSVSWRFSLQPVADALRVKMDRLLRADAGMLREQLEDLELAVANWERAGRRRNGGRSGRNVSANQAEFW